MSVYTNTDRLDYQTSLSDQSLLTTKTAQYLHKIHGVTPRRHLVEILTVDKSELKSELKRGNAKQIYGTAIRGPCITVGEVPLTTAGGRGDVYDETLLQETVPTIWRRQLPEKENDVTVTPCSGRSDFSKGRNV